MTTPASARTAAVSRVHSIPSEAAGRRSGGIDGPEQRRVQAGPAAQSLRTNLAWMVVGTVWYGFCQWALLIVLAKMGTVEMVGGYTLGVAIATPILMFGCLNLRSIFVTDNESIFHFPEYLALRLAMLLASVAVASAVGIVGGHGPELVFFIAAITTAKALDYVSDIFYALLQREERMRAISVSMMIKGTLGLCAMALAIHWHGSLRAGGLALVISSGLVLVFFDIPVSLNLLDMKFRPAARQWLSYGKTLLTGAGGAYRRLMSLAFAGAPLGVVVMLVSLNLNIPRYFVEQSMGMREQGIFSSLVNLMSAGSVAMGALGQCATPRLAKTFAAGNMREFRRLLWTLAGISAAAGTVGFLAAALFGRQILTLAYRPEYAARQDVLVWLMAASGALYLGSMMGVAVTAVRCFAPQLPLFALAAATTALACYLLVPTMGMRGAALAIFISSIIQSAGGALLLRYACARRKSAAAAA
jgi:O-antigen/teichoic acid export membrane protein